MVAVNNLSEAALKEVAEAVFNVYEYVSKTKLREIPWADIARDKGYNTRTSAIVAALLDKNERYWSEWARNIVCPLKKCPFCGGEAHYSTSDNKNEYHEVSCGKCNSYIVGESKEVVIRKWNNRTYE